MRISGEWWRAGSYEIVDDVVRPTAAAESYGPEFKPVSPSRARSEAPYAELLQLVPGRLEDWLEPSGTAYSALEDWESPYRAPNPDRLTTRARTALRRWVSSHGLLGVLHHQIRRVTYPPFWVEWGGEGQVQPLGPLSVEIERVSGEFVRRFRADAGSLPIGIGDLEDFPRPPVETSLGDEYEPGVEVCPLLSVSGGCIRQPLATTWARFFRHVPEGDEESYAYPLLDAREGEEAYQEPLADFLLGAVALRSAVEEAARVLGGASGTFGPLDALVAPGLVSMTVEGGEVVDSFRGPSLLSYLAFMVREDLRAGGRPYHCDWCGGIFIATGRRATYCSDRHRTAATKDRQRRAARETSQAS